MGSSETCPPVVNNTGQQQMIFLPVPEPSLSILSLQENKKKRKVFGGVKPAAASLLEVGQEMKS